MGEGKPACPAYRRMNIILFVRATLALGMGRTLFGS